MLSHSLHRKLPLTSELTKEHKAIDAQQYLPDLSEADARFLMMFEVQVCQATFLTFEVLVGICQHTMQLIKG